MMIMTGYSIKTNSLNKTLNRANLFAAIRKRTGSSPRGGREGTSAPAGWMVASILVGRVVASFLLFISLSFSSCSTDDDGGITPVDDGRQTVQLYLSVPSSNATRIGDPGQAVPEGEDWDRLAVMIEYVDGIQTDKDKYYLKIIKREEYENLDERDGYRWIGLDLLPGKVNIYGVTYSSDATNNPEQAITDIATNGGSYKELEISNDYAMNDEAHVAKFLSVATGFYQDESGNLKDFVVEANPDWTAEDMPTMRLTRLAAKIDIQWDAQEAYGSAYSDIKVTGFTFSGDNAEANNSTDENEKSGSGRLFPFLTLGKDNATQLTPLSGSKTFINQTPISQRNGRVYHYVYPDGVSTPKVTFKITAKKEENGITTNVDNNYIYTFNAKLQKATWYKIRTYINGFTNQETNIITPEGPKTVETE